MSRSNIHSLFQKLQRKSSQTDCSRGCRLTYQRSRRCSEARKCAKAQLPQTQCNVPEPNPTLASPVTESETARKIAQAIFVTDSEGAGLASHPLQHNRPLPRPAGSGRESLHLPSRDSMRLALLLNAVR